MLENHVLLFISICFSPSLAISTLRRSHKKETVFGTSKRRIESMTLKHGATCLIEQVAAITSNDAVAYTCPLSEYVVYRTA